MNLIQGEKRNLIIDNRIRENEYAYLSKYFNVVKLSLNHDVYDEISGHTDIFYCNINEKIICAPNAKIKENSFIIGNEIAKGEYPSDVKYNVCQIGKNLIANKFVDSKVIETWEDSINKTKSNQKDNNEKENLIVVNQGYVKCSIAVTGDNSCITTDKGIYEKLKQNGIDAVFITEDNIKLLDKKSKTTKMHGFIGGATFKIDDKFILFGDINKFKEKNRIMVMEHLKKYNLSLVDFKNLEIYDYGGAIVF